MAVALVLGACDAGPSAVVHDGEGKSPTGKTAHEPRVATAPSSALASADAPASIPADVHARDVEAAKAYGPIAPGPRAEITETTYGDWPLWSKTRKFSPAENSRNAFAKHGDEVGAKTYEDYVAIVHGFVHNPPPGTQKLVRANGDVLLFDEKRDVFAVITKQGAPRTLFRPYDGEAYWRQQQAIEAAKTTGSVSATEEGQ
ncbi:MAG: hypothetical protein ACXU8O_05355 [Asticcacaulis sp.]